MKQIPIYILGVLATVFFLAIFFEDQIVSVSDSIQNEQNKERKIKSREVVLEEDGKKITVVERDVYDVRGNMIKQTIFDNNNDGSIRSFAISQYDQKNRETERKETFPAIGNRKTTNFFYNAFDSLDYEITVSYEQDANGMISEIKSGCRYQYNDQKQMTEAVTTVEGKITEKKEYKRDESGHLNSIFVFGEEEILTYTMTFDAKGNLIKEIKTSTNKDLTSNGEADDVTRIIDYDSKKRMVKEFLSEPNGNWTVALYKYFPEGDYEMSVYFSRENYKSRTPDMKFTYKHSYFEGY